MVLKKIIRSIVPSPLYEAAHKIKVAAAPSQPLVEETRPRIFLSYSPRPTFAEAAAECGQGYSGEQILEKAHSSPHAWLTEMQDYAAPLLASVALAAMNSQNHRLKVLDFGGGIGIFKSYVYEYFEQRIDTDWTVVEVPEQVAFNMDCTQPNLRFSTAIKPELYDFAIFCGSLQYVDDWQSTLRQTDAKMLLISRSPLAEVEQPYIQTIGRNGHVSRVPARVLSEPELFALLSERYEYFAKWDATSHLIEMGEFRSPAILWRRKPASNIRQ